MPQPKVEGPAPSRPGRIFQLTVACDVARKRHGRPARGSQKPTHGQDAHATSHDRHLEDLQPQAPFCAICPKLPRIHTVRGQRVVLDSDLAALYGVPTKAFNQTIRRNAARFSSDFLFQLAEEEFAKLRSQIVTSSSDGNRVLRSQIVTLEMDRRGRHRKYLP